MYTAVSMKSENCLVNTCNPSDTHPPANLLDAALATVAVERIEDRQEAGRLREALGRHEQHLREWIDFRRILGPFLSCRSYHGCSEVLLEWPMINI